MEMAQGACRLFIAVGNGLLVPGFCFFVIFFNAVAVRIAVAYVEHGGSVALVGCFQVPFQGLRVIDRGSFAVQVAPSQVELGRIVPLFGCLGVPVDGSLLMFISTPCPLP